MLIASLCILLTFWFPLVSSLDDFPDYWQNSNDERQVDLAMFNITTIAQRAKLPKRLYPLESSWHKHWEVHLGKVAWSVFFYEGNKDRRTGLSSNGHKEVQFRRREKSQRVFGLELSREKNMCKTRRSDTEIYNYIKTHWRGSSHYLERDCQMFARFLIRYLCDTPKLSKMMPRHYRYVIRPVRGFFRNVRRNEGKKNLSGLVAWFMNRMNPALLKGFNDDGEWNISERT